MERELQMSNKVNLPVRGRPFAKGQVANPGGRPPGLPDRRTRYREIIEQRMPELLERCVSMALQGDIQALRLCLERVLPAVRPGDERVELSISAAEGLSVQARKVADAAYTGKVAVSTAEALLSVITAQARVLELDELVNRIQTLEAVAAQRSSQTRRA